MAPSIKNSKNNGLINPWNWTNRVPSTTDGGADFYNRYNASFHGFLFSDGQCYNQQGQQVPISDGTYTSIAFPVGTYNEIAFQPIGSGMTITVLGSLVADPTLNSFVPANVVTGGDGIIRVESMYKFIQVSVTGVGATNSLYMQIW